MKRILKSKLIQKIGICLTLIILLGGVGITDETKDDLSVQLYILACDGAPTYIHNWISPLWILPLFYLQKLVPHIALHYFIQVLLIFVCIILITNEILSKYKNVFGKIFAILTTFILFYQTVSTFNFTRTAILLVATGMMLLSKKKKTDYLYGAVLMLMGSILRFDVIYISFGFYCIICFWHWVCSKKQESVSRIWVQVFLPYVVVFILAYGINNLGCSIIENDNIWNEYVTKNETLAEIMDYSLADYEENREGYEELGISENDYKMLTTRMANSDSEYFSEELYEKIAERYSGKWKLDLSGSAIYEWIRNVGRYTIKCYFSWYILIILLISFILLMKKGKWWFPIITGCCMVAYLAFFGIMGRMVDRVIFGVFLCAGITMLIGIEDINCSFLLTSLKKKMVIGVSCILCTGLICGIGISEKRIINQDMAEVFAYMENHGNQFFGYTRYSISEVQAIPNLLFVDTYYETGNSMYLTQLDISPNEKQKLEAYGITNLYKDAVDSDVIRFVDSRYIHRIEKHIEEHYNSSVSAEVEMTIGEYNIYRIVSE